MNNMAANGQAMQRLRCATVGVMASLATTAVFMIGLALIMRFVDIRIESYPMSKSSTQQNIR